MSDGWSTAASWCGSSRPSTRAFATGQPSPLPELPIQYADFAVWQRDWLQGEVLATQLAYWRRQLAGALPVLPLPTRPTATGDPDLRRGARQSRLLPQGLTAALKALGLSARARPSS